MYLLVSMMSLLRFRRARGICPSEQSPRRRVSSCRGFHYTLADLALVGLVGVPPKRPFVWAVTASTGDTSAPSAPLSEPPVHLVVVALADRDDAQQAISDIEDDAVLPHRDSGILIALETFGVRRLRVCHQHDDLACDLPVLLGRQRVEKADRRLRQAKRQHGPRRKRKRSGPPLNQVSSGMGSPRILAASTSLR